MGSCDRRSEAGIQLGRLVAGSEGTLAIVLQAVLRTVPLPAAQGVVVLPFVGLSDAAAFVPELLAPRSRRRLRATCSTAGRSAWLATPTSRVAAGSMRRPRRS